MMTYKGIMCSTNEIVNSCWNFGCDVTIRQWTKDVRCDFRTAFLLPDVEKIDYWGQGSTTTETVYGCGGTPSFPQKTAFFFDFLVPAAAPAAAAAAPFLEFNQNRKTVKA
jgi:hypothetical protein